MICFRLLDTDDPAEPLSEQIEALRDGQAQSGVFNVRPESFHQIPNSPFAYWVSEQIRSLFPQLDSFADREIPIRHGPATSNDFKLLRCWWEIEGLKGTEVLKWIPYAKGGAPKLFFCDQPLVVAWENRRFTFHGFFGRPGRWQVRLESSDLFFRPGITWPLRASRFAPQAMPAGCIFSARGYALLANSDELPSLLALTSSHLFDFLFKLLLGRSGFPEFVVGALQDLPIPSIGTDDTAELGALALRGWQVQRLPRSSSLTSHAFLLPALIKGTEKNPTLESQIEGWEQLLDATASTLAAIQDKVDSIAYRVYEIADSDRQEIEQVLKSKSAEEGESEELEDDDASAADAPDLVSDVIDYSLGGSFGRWDIRYATGERQPPELPDPFDPLPVCPPGMLQNADGLPAAKEDEPDGYPMPITWPGILVSDPGHPEDIVARVRDALAVIWGDRSAAIEQEACEILGVRTLRDYFAEKKSGGKFFKDHLKRYSKSRRQAPIYWPLSTESGTYTLWIYYHRLTGDTLYTAVSDFVEPKIASVSRDLERLTAKGDQRTSTENKDWEKLTDLSGELQVFRDELLRIANLPWKPNLNDGVQITAAPLWNLFRLKPWQKKLKETWNKLEKGEYDWAHSAHTLWPDRVIPKCATDRSLAIAHGYEADLWEEVENDKGKMAWQPKDDADDIAQQLIEQHRN